MFLVNGKTSATVDLTDRGFQYGDGLFETITVINQQPIFLERHLQRLQAGCQTLLIPYPGTKMIAAEINALCKHAPLSGKAVLKLIITRGIGGRGYRQPDLIQPTRVIGLHSSPDYPDSYPNQGVVARFCDTRLGLHPVLAGLKHLNRLEQVLARAEWCDTAIQEGIMLDCNDHVIEGTMSNLFYSKNNVLYTAKLVQSGVAGIMRGVIMAIAAQQKLTVIEHYFDKAALLAADEIFFSNAVIGIWPVKQIETHSLSVGPLTRQLQAWVAQLQAASINIAL
jgi:4-amino-4-deoxychorismate lyase